MHRSKVIVLTVLVALVTAIGPMLAAVFVAQRQGLNLEFERVHGYAREVLFRSDRAVRQMAQAVSTMQAAGLQPCSPEMLSMFLAIGLELQYIIAVGYIEGDTVYCSTFGQHPNGFDLGPVDFITPVGSGVRLDVRFPFLDESAILAIQRGNFVAISHRNQAVDLTTAEEGTVLGTFTPGLPSIRTARGEPDPRWIERLGDERETVFVDNDYIVAIALSEQSASTGAIAAVPLRYLNERVLEFAIFLLPIGLLTALMLTVLVLYLAHHQMSQPNEIRMALRRRQFFLVYQPIVEMSTGRWVGAEALLRWRRSDGQTGMPDSFIPIAEQSDLINRLTAEVIALAEQDMAEIMREDEVLSLSLNLSARDLQSPETLGQLERLWSALGRRAGQLTVELTERMLLAPETARRNVARVRASGIRVAIDDFGTGYSSLSYLETMQFDSLKIDKLFVEAIGTDAATNRVVLHIIEMARTLGLAIVAEGVETPVQAEFLLAHGVEYGQGWYFGYPMGAADFAEALRRDRGRRNGPAGQ